jgi:hypothetical protein
MIDRKTDRKTDIHIILKSDRKREIKEKNRKCTVLTEKCTERNQGRESCSNGDAKNSEGVLDWFLKLDKRWVLLMAGWLAKKRRYLT